MYYANKQKTLKLYSCISGFLLETHQLPPWDYSTTVTEIYKVLNNHRNRLCISFNALLGMAFKLVILPSCNVSIKCISTVFPIHDF